MSPPAPTVGVPFLEPSGHPDAVQAAGAEPVPLRLPPAFPGGGVALAREWVADATEVSCAGTGVDALLLAAERPEELFGMLLAAVRLDLPTVCAPPPGSPLSAAFVALGLAPIAGEAAEVAVDLAGYGGPHPGEILDNFSLANALRAGVAAGGGPGLLVHLAALAREAGVVGFSQMLRVLVQETQAADLAWTRESGVPAVLASLGDDLHDIPTVSGRLKEGLPSSSPALEKRSRLVFVRGRASGAEAVCRISGDVPEVAGECRVFDSEESAVHAVRTEEVGTGTLLVVRGCGPRGGPGTVPLDALGSALTESGLEDVPVLTDGLPPAREKGIWISLFTPEAAAGGVICLLRDGDALRFDLNGRRIRTGVSAEEFEGRVPYSGQDPGRGYAGRYARTALPALEGAGFG